VVHQVPDVHGGEGDQADAAAGGVLHGDGGHVLHSGGAVRVRVQPQPLPRTERRRLDAALALLQFAQPTAVVQEQ